MYRRSCSTGDTSVNETNSVLADCPYYYSVQTGKFLAQVFLSQKTRASYTFTLRKLSVQESCYTLWKNPISSRLSNQRQEFHDRNLPTCSILAIFWRQFFVPEKRHQKPCSHQQILWRKKLATETCRSECGFSLLLYSRFVSDIFPPYLFFISSYLHLSAAQPSPLVSSCNTWNLLHSSCWLTNRSEFNVIMQ